MVDEETWLSFSPLTINHQPSTIQTLVFAERVVGYHDVVHVLHVERGDVDATGRYQTPGYEQDDQQHFRYPFHS